MKPAEKFLAINTGELEWEDGQAIMGLPAGVQVKIIAQGVDDVSERVDKFVKFPPGYVEPRHTHNYSHSTLIIEGEMHVGGKVLKPGDYLFGGANEPHGPLHYPVGCTVFGSGRGVKLSQIHKY
ncbi:MAG: cupin domain-containing protein [Chloroflexi bacterium]|nr:cupin domain-containing protein [Chloroflexota bacterium]